MKQGTKHSKETIEKIRLKKLLNPTNYWLGKNRSEETKRKISNTKTGIHLSEENKLKIKLSAINNPNFGMRNKHHSKESRIKIGLAGLGRKPWNYLDGRSNHPLTRKIIKGFPIAYHIWCKYNYPYIPKGFIIHHIDCNPNNNNINNLALLPDKYHRSLHNKIYKMLLQGGKTDG